jgi:Ca2+-binding EF-hand superfamily protein
MCHFACHSQTDAITHEQFARIMTTDNIIALKDEIMANKAGWHKNPDQTGLAIGQKFGGEKKARGIGDNDALKGLDKREVIKAHNALYDHFTKRFSDVRKGFKVFDTDMSGEISRDEMRKVIHLFKLNIKPEIAEAFISLADYNQTNSIKYADFARLMLSEDIYAMKQSLHAQDQAWKFKTKQKEKTAAHHAAAEQRKAQWMAMAHFISPDIAPTSGTAGLDFGAPRRGPPMLRHGVKPFDIRDCQRQLKLAILAKHGSLDEAFILAEAAQPGVLDRDELVKLMKTFVPRIREQVLQNICDFVDEDQDGEILLSEWMKCLKAEDILSVQRKPSKLL